MSEIRVELAHDFKWEAVVVLLAMDGDGLEAFRSALARAGRKQRRSSLLTHAGTIHEFAIEGGNAEVELQAGRVIWRLAQAKLAEIVEKLNAMDKTLGACHQYVDISSPAKILVLSRDEYQ